MEGSVNARLRDVVQLAKAGQRQEALLRLREYIQQHPQDADAWVVLGGLAPDFRVAQSALRRALQLDPENVTARRVLVSLEKRWGVTPPSGRPPAEQPAPEIPPPAPEPETEPEPETPSPAPEPEPEPKTPPPAPEPGPSCVEEFRAMREARKVIWPFMPRGEKKRPLGDLVDEGRVTRQDLAWAAEEAREAKIRDAARTLLDTLRRIPNVAVNPETARLISWPYRRLNRPLGELVDEATVEVKDLRRAAWFAEDARLREAARQMLPVAERRREIKGQRAQARKRAPQKQEPPRPPETPPARSKNTYPAYERPAMRPMAVIQGSDYLAREIRKRYLNQEIALGVGILLLLGGAGTAIYFIWTALASRSLLPWWTIPLLVGLGFVLIRLWDYMGEVRQEEQTFRQGYEGEIKVARQLRQGLGGDWTLFRNVQLPDMPHDDLDMVLLGPPGVFILEVKAYRGNFRYRGEHFYRGTVVGWRRQRRNPGKQALAGGRKLRRYVNETLNRELDVEARLVWVGPGHLSLYKPEVFVWYMDRLLKETERLRSLPATLSPEDRAALSGLLRGLCSTLH